MQDHDPTNKIKKMLKVPFLEVIYDQAVFDDNFEKMFTLRILVTNGSPGWVELKKILNWWSSETADDLKRIFLAEPFLKYKNRKTDGPFWLLSIEGRMYLIGYYRICYWSLF